MNNYRDEIYLAHHGVKGMKWGQRKQRKPFTSEYTKAYRSAAKRQSNKAAKYRAKADKRSAKYMSKASKAENKYKQYDKYAKKSAELDKKVDDIRANRTRLQKVGAVFMNSLDGNRSYDSLKASGVSTGKAIVSSMLNPSAGLTARDRYVKRK